MTPPMLFSPWYHNHPLTVMSTKGETCVANSRASHHGVDSPDRWLHLPMDVDVLYMYSSIRCPPMAVLVMPIGTSTPSSAKR